MTKKDYILIASTINSERATWSKEATQAHEAIRSLANALAGKLRAENTRFDYFRFIEACGIASCDGKHDSVNAILKCEVCKNDPLLK